MRRIAVVLVVVLASQREARAALTSSLTPEAAMPLTVRYSSRTSLVFDAGIQFVF